MHYIEMYIFICMYGGVFFKQLEFNFFLSCFLESGTALPTLFAMSVIWNKVSIS
jgi:hypothetical protein